MALTLKASGIATNLVACVAVDDDGTTVKDFVSGNTIALDTGVAASVATGSWKSISSPKYFVTTANGTFDFNGVRWTGTVPALDETDGDGVSAWFACNGAGVMGPGFAAAFVEISDTFGLAKGLRRVGTADNHGMFDSGGGTLAATATNLPVDGTTQFSFGANYVWNSSTEVFYGLETGSLASDGTAGADGGFGAATAAVRTIGGTSGSGSQPLKPYIVCVFNRTLTTGEMQSLHNDWFGTLFDAPAGVLAGTTPINLTLTGTLTASALALMGQILL